MSEKTLPGIRHLLMALDRFSAHVDSVARWLDERLGRVGSAAVVGVLLTAGAMLLARPSDIPVNHGELYARLSNAPFAFEKGIWVQNRILTPLIAYGLHLRGRNFVFVPRIFVALLLSATYGHYRRAGFAGATAVGMSAALAVSTPVLFPLHFSGYPDPATTLLLFWCFAWNARPWLRGILFSLALFNHENALFALPWLVVDARPSDRPLRRTLIFLGVAGLGAAAYCAWRNFVYCHVAVRFTAGFYLRTGRIVKNLGRVDGLVPLGTIEAFRSLWFFPLLAVINAWRIRAWRSSLWIAAVVGSAGLQIVFAHDVSRLMGMAFPAVLFGAELFGERYGEKTLTLWLWLAVIINLALPAYDITPAGMIPLLPFW